MFSLGAAMLLLGFLYDGSNKDTVATILILLGAAELAIAALFSRLRELEVGPGKFRARLEASDEDFRAVFEAEAPRLERFGKLMCGDPELARELAEEALARAGKERRVTRAERGRVALRTLLDALETAHERKWVRGSGGGSAPPPAGPREREIIDALASLEFSERAAFLLRVDWPLRNDEVAALLGRSVEDVRDDVVRAQERLQPYIRSIEGPADVD